MKIKPTQGQLDFLKWEYGMFFHFGIRSFNPGHVDWDGREMALETFNPDALDCEDWIKTAKAAGATYAIMTTKHHDGFALWPSAYSTYSVAQTPWKDGKGDVVREFVDACRKHGVKVGLYYSPAQWGSHSIKFASGKEYDDYFINQITELLGNYGKIDYLWFDGCGSEGHEYDKKRIVAEIFRLQPEILTFCDPEWNPCIRWVGNEDGYAELNNPLTVAAWDFSELSEESVELTQAYCMPAECDCKLRDTWFYDLNEDTIKSVDELFGMYEASVGRGSNFLINIGPDNHGLLPDADKARILELAEKIRAAYSEPVPFGEIEQDGDSYTVTSPEYSVRNPIPSHDRLINRVVISEDITDGQAVKAFKIYANLPHYKHKRVQLYIGATIGNKVICQIPTIRASKITVEITDSDGDHKITEIKAYYVK